MKLSRLVRFVSAIIILTAATAFTFQARAQICTGCEIPSAQRTDRLNAANQALQTAGSQQNGLITTHSPWGLPRSKSSAKNERLLFQFEWITLYDDDLVMPLWVAYELTRLELKVNGWARGKDGIFIVTGAVFDRDENGKRDKDEDAVRVAPRNRMAVATHFYKILLKRRTDGKFETISFLLPHDRRNDNNTNPTIANEYLVSKIETIDKIEKLTGINFFPNMVSNKQKKIEKNKAASLDNWFVF